MITGIPDLEVLQPNAQPAMTNALAVLRAVDVAHRDGKITCGTRYHILQSLFPPVEARTSNAADFATATESVTPEHTIDDNVAPIRMHERHDQATSHRRNIAEFDIAN